MGRPVSKIDLSQEEFEKLQLIGRRPKSAQGMALRANIVLSCAQGKTNQAVAQGLGVCMNTVGKWRRRFAAERMAGLVDAPRSGAPREISDQKVEEVVTKTLETTPPARTHWSSWLMAKEAGISQHSVRRIWQAFGLKPHLVKSFKLSSDPMFVEKVRDIVGLYLNPPEKAIVLCVDEKSQIQALQRTQPGLPLKKGRCGTLTHDYTRHGTTTLFAALDVLEGRVIGQCLPRHRHQEFLKFLRTLDSAFPQDKSLHLIVDNYGTHKHPSVVRWLKNHPRFVLHFTPTSSSWLNLVERWFGELTRKALRRASFVSVPDLIAAIETYLAASNENPKPFTWSATPESILAKISKVKSIYETLH